MKKVIAEVATLLGSALLLLTVLFTVVQLVINNNIVGKTFLSAIETNNINETNITNEVNATNELAELDKKEEKVNEIVEQDGQEVMQETAIETASVEADKPMAIAANTTTYRDWSALGNYDDLDGASSSTLMYNFSGDNPTKMYINYKTKNGQTKKWDNSSNNTQLPII